MPAHKNYRHEWVSAGYKADMGSAVACRPPASPDVIRVYHLMSAGYAISNIELARLKLARFSDLNDPFELLGLSLRERGMREAVTAFKTDVGARIGLLCFSEDWTEPVMWSHYAMKHRGICLGFDIARKRLEKIAYEDQRILAGLGNDLSPKVISDELQRLLLRTKSVGWKYEAEYRWLIPLQEALPDGPLHFVSFSAGMRLAEVILGPLYDCSLEATRQLVDSLHDDVTTFQARLAFKWFKVVPDERTIP